MEADANLVGDLVKHLPAIRRWIDEVLARSRPLATRVDRLPFSRLSSFFSPDTLRSAHVLEVDRVPVPPMAAMGLKGFSDFEHMDMDGITYQDVYFVKHGCARNEPLHFHELVHVIQWRILGPERFTLAYALGHALHGGYANNPFEKMAHTLQTRFESNDPPFSVEPLVTHRLEPLVQSLFAAIR